MTFEYRDPDYDLLRVEPAPHHSDGPRIILHAEFTHDLGTDMAEVAVPLDHVEEVIAGIRDAARTASGQQPETEKPTLRDRLRRAVCEAEGFTWDSDMLKPDEYGDHADAVLAVLAAHETTAPAVGQPAEAQGTARQAHRRLAAVERLVSGRPGYHQITVKELLTAMSDETVEDER